MKSFIRLCFSTKLLVDESNEPVAHPDVTLIWPFNGKVYEILQGARN